MRPDAAARPEFVAAFRELAERIEQVLVNTPKRNLPIKMFVAGGAALHFYTGARVSEDVDAVFSRRIALPENNNKSNDVGPVRDSSPLGRRLDSALPPTIVREPPTHYFPATHALCRPVLKT